ncbi:hypothetical protein ACHHYP_04406 [Achlya hypogyna]|uniref:PX domain-containing protein n=1 Tax=Achlya hypogyna TaxID=1202772 RepID=A0A1V9Z181_ACHHY|nr:hypothetical protein ACHHYP_04406 [Achlya hypogyna]
MTGESASMIHGPSSFLHQVDVMIAAVDDSYEGGHHHTKYVVQVTERDHGHWIVPRRYSQFRVLADATRSILARARPRATKANASHESVVLALRGFQFPKKTMHFGFLGTPATSREVVFDRLRQLHLYLQAMTRVLRTFNWDPAAQQTNGISRDQAIMLSRLLRGFLAVPDNLGEYPSRYVHTNPRCRNAASIYCAQHAVLQENASKKQQELAVQAAHRAKPYATMLDNYGSVLETQRLANATMRSSRAPSYPMHKLEEGSYKQSMLRPSILFLHNEATGGDHGESLSDDIPLLCASPTDTIILGD